MELKKTEVRKAIRLLYPWDQRPGVVRVKSGRRQVGKADFVADCIWCGRCTSWSDGPAGVRAAKRFYARHDECAAQLVNRARELVEGVYKIYGE